MRRVLERITLEKHFLDIDGIEPPPGSGVLIRRDEAANEAALPIVGYLRGEWPRAWRLVDAFEREFLSGDSREQNLDARTIAQWIERRERQHPKPP